MHVFPRFSLFSLPFHQLSATCIDFHHGSQKISPLSYHAWFWAPAGFITGHNDKTMDTRIYLNQNQLTVIIVINNVMKIQSIFIYPVAAGPIHCYLY